MTTPKRNLKYWLDGDEIKSREVTLEELQTARDAASAKAREMAMRSCWNCNPAHSHFLTSKPDGFFFCCIMGCGNYFFDGINVTDYSEGP